MTSTHPSRWLQRLKRALILLTLLELMLLAAPPLLRGVAEQQLGALLMRRLQIGSLSLNPLTMTLEAKAVSLATAAGERQLAFERLRINANLWGSLRHRGVVIDSIELERPDVYLARTGAHRYNISDLLDKFLDQPDDDSPTRFSLNNLTLQHGRIVFDDQPQRSRQEIDQLQLSLPFLSNLPYFVDDPVKPGISGRLNGARFASTAQSKPFSPARESSIDIRLDDVDLTHYLAYLPATLQFRVASARLDSKLTLGFAQPADQPPSVALAGQIALRRLQLQQTDGSALFGWENAELQIARVEPLLQRYHFRQLVLTRPDVTLQRDRDGRLNLQRIFAPAPARPAADRGGKTAGPALQLALDKLVLQQGHLHWHDQQTGFATRLDPVGLQLQHFSLKPGQPASFDLRLDSAQGERFAAQGRFSLQPLTLDTRLELQQLAVPHYAPYYRRLLPLGVAGGKLDAAARLIVDADGTRLQQLALGLSETRLLPPRGKQPFLTLPALNLQQGELDLAQRRLHIGAIDSRGLQLKLRRNQQGQLDLQQWLEPADSTEAEKPAPRWDLQLQQLTLDDYAVDFFDEAPLEDARIQLSQLQLKARNISLDQPAGIELTTRINRSGRLKASGTVRPRPLQADLRLNAGAVELVPLQPYFGHRLNLSLTRGTLGGNGRLRFAATPQPAFGFNGTLRIDRLASIDKLNRADFINWKVLQLDGVQASDSRLAVERIALADFYARLLVNPDGRLNLMDIVVQDDGSGATPLAAEPAAAGTTNAGPEPFPVHIKRVQLTGGNIQFSDYFIRPNYSANMTQIGGSINGLSSAADTRANIDLKGSVNNNAQFSLAGSLNPLARQLFLDIKAGIKGFEMIPTSPYAGKYAGYGINKGKLSMEISYFVEQNQLKAQNHLFLDQLTLGDKVDSPDATALPVRLALSLLQNRRGEIDINLPIEGSLDDPQFKIGRVIVQVLKNLLEKAVTAPFALLTSGSGGQELSFVDFAPGSSSLTPAAQARLDALAGALQDRPALKLEIAGHADAGTDIAGLKQLALQQKVRAQKLRNMARLGQAADDSVVVGRDEYPALLKAAYQAEDFPKPRNLIGLAKDIPQAEMENLLLQHISVRPDDLQQLATLRAFAAKNALLQSGKVDDARLFIVSAKPGAAPPGSSPGRVDFGLAAP